MNRRVRTPKHCHHKPSGRGYVRLNGKCHYTGVWGSEKAERRYAELLSTWLANGRTPIERVEETNYRVRDLIADFLSYADGYYRKNGKPTKEIVNIRYALKPMLVLFGEATANHFGPKALKVYREALIKNNLCRNLINQRVGIVKRVFSWGASEEKIAGECAAALRSVPGLKFGRSEARESKPVKPVTKSDFEATLKELGAIVAAMARLQWLTGMRPGEVVQMRWMDFDTTGPVWLYRPHSHKTEHHGRQRIIPLGPRAQEVLSKFRKLDSFAPIFSSKPIGSRMAVSQYSSITYRQAIGRACDRAGVRRWTPNQLRHSAATRVRREFGLEAARALLGHSSSSVTEIYAELDSNQAANVMGEIG